MPQIIPTAQRVLQVFEVYARERRPLTNSEMARMLDLADSSCSDLLYTLRQAGYLLRTPKSRYFHPTGRLLDVAQGIAAADPLQAFAGEALEILTRQSGESSMCGLLDGNKVKIYASQESPRALRYVVQPGTTFALHVAAMGKALLGEMGEAERNALIDTMQFEHVTASSIADAATLRAQIEAQREQALHQPRRRQRGRLGHRHRRPRGRPADGPVHRRPDPSDGRQHGAVRQGRAGGSGGILRK